MRYILLLALLAAGADSSRAIAGDGASTTATSSVATAPAPAADLTEVAIAKGTPAPFGGVLLPSNRATYILELVADGKAARAGDFAMPAWQRYTLIGLATAATALQVYNATKRKS